MKKFRFLPVLVVAVSLFLCGFCKKVNLFGPDQPDPGNGQTTSIHISASISLNGLPFADVDIYLSGSNSQSTKTGADGAFSFTSLPPGTYFITPSKMGYSFNPAYYEFSSSVENLSVTAQIAAYGKEIGELMADFAASNQNNENISLYNFFGKLVLVNFSADWCGPCRSEASRLNEIYTTYKDKGLVIITVLISGSNTTWSQTYGLDFPVLDDRQELIYQIYRTGFVPLNYFLGRNGNILYKRDGFNKSEIEELIQKFI
jgi:peroxiredoxin